MLTSALQQQLSAHRAQNLWRHRLAIDARDDRKIVINGKSLINFCGNDYLGLATAAPIKAAFIRGINQFGFGSSASAAVSGYYRCHQILEEKFAEFLQREKAVLFNSGYHANVGIFSALATRQSVILSDKLCHASILDGILLSRANHLRYPHNNLKRAAQILQTVKNKNVFLVTESIFSLEGDLSPINQLAALTQKNGALFIVDDAHGAGILGEQGRGICEYYHLTTPEVPCLMTPLGKAFGGMGAIVSGDKNLMEALLQFCRTYRYTTALPPAFAMAMHAALVTLQTETWRREKLRYLIKFFIKQIQAHYLPLISADETPIKCILISDNKMAVKIQEELMAHGFFVSCIRPPSVPKNTARIRITLSCCHEENDIKRLIDVLAKSYEKFFIAP